MTQNNRREFKQKLKRFLARNLPPCIEMVRLFSDARERKLTLREKFISELHLRICESCRRYTEQIQAISEYLKQKTNSESDSQFTFRLSNEARRRIENAIEKHSAESNRRKN